MGEYEDFLAHGDVARFVASYAGRHDPLDALWWLSHPLETAPSGVDAPAAARAGLQAAAYSRDGGVEAERALASFEQQLADDHAAMLAALASAAERSTTESAVLPTGGESVEAAEAEGGPGEPRPYRGLRVAVATGLAVVLVVAVVVVVRPLLVTSSEPRSGAASGSAAPSSGSTADASSPSAPIPVAQQPSGEPVVASVTSIGTATCYTLVDVDTIGMFGAQGYSNISPAVVDNSRAEPESGLYPFAIDGGLVCAWGGSAVRAAYAYSPITSSDAAVQQDRLDLQGFVPSSAHGLVYYGNDDATYVFGSGYWAYSTLTVNLIDEVNAHVPENAGTKRTDVQSAVFVTSEGVGDVRIGRPVPSNSALVSWNPTACTTGTGPWTGAWRPRAAFADETKGYKTNLDVVTADGYRTGAIATILIYSPEIPTKSGIRVGDSRAKVDTAFPDMAKSDYTLSSAHGKIRFEIGSVDPDRPETEVVLAIYVVRTGDTFPAMGSDANGSCKG